MLATGAGPQVAGPCVWVTAGRVAGEPDWGVGARVCPCTGGGLCQPLAWGSTSPGLLACLGASKMRGRLLGGNVPKPSYQRDSRCMYTYIYFPLTNLNLDKPERGTGWGHWCLCERCGFCVAGSVFVCIGAVQLCVHVCAYWEHMLLIGPGSVELQPPSPCCQAAGFSNIKQVLFWVFLQEIHACLYICFVWFKWNQLLIFMCVCSPCKMVFVVLFLAIFSKWRAKYKWIQEQ